MSLTNIDVRSARHIVMLAKHGSFSRAAEEVGVTQSALSRSIQQVEDDSAVRLFDRSRSGVFPTLIGKVVIRQAQVLLREAGELGRLLSRAADPERDHVTFGVGRIPAPTFLSPVLIEALRLRPGLHCQALNRTPDELLSLLIGEDIEFAVCAGQLGKGTAALRGLEIAKFEVVHAVRPGHPLLQPKTSLKFRDFPWIRSHRVNEHFVGNNVWPHLRDQPQIAVEDVASAACLTAQSDMIWVTSIFSAASEIREGRLVSLPKDAVKMASPIKLMFYSLRGRSLSPAAQLLSDVFRTVAASIVA